MSVAFERKYIIRTLREDYSDSHWANADARNGSFINFDLVQSYEDDVVEALINAFENTEAMPFSEIVRMTNDSISRWFDDAVLKSSRMPSRILLPDLLGAEESQSQVSAAVKRQFKAYVARRLHQAIVFENDHLVPQSFWLSDAAPHERGLQSAIRMPQVFLSYQYTDRLYTMGLYYAFAREGFYLYADWMHNGKIDDTDKLKRILLGEVRDSDHFASLPSVKAAFGLNDDRNETTSWCAWEVGARRELALRNDDEKILICVSNHGNYGGIFGTFHEAHSMDDVMAIWS